MTSLERDIQVFILRALLKADGAPMPDEALRDAIRARFTHVAFSAQDITRHISAAETATFIAPSNNKLLGLLWSLTPKGQAQAEQLA